MRWVRRRRRGRERSEIAKEHGKSEEEIYCLKSRRKYGANFLLALLKCLVFLNKEIREWVSSNGLEEIELQNWMGMILKIHNGFFKFKFLIFEIISKS